MTVRRLLSSPNFVRFCSLEYGYSFEELQGCSVELLQELLDAWRLVPSCLRGIAPSPSFPVSCLKG